VSEIVTDKLGSLRSTPAHDNTLNQHDLGRVLLHNSFAFAVL